MKTMNRILTIFLVLCACGECIADTIESADSISAIAFSKAKQMQEVVVSSNGVDRIKRQPFNTISIDTKTMETASRSLGDALAKAPGVKLRENGGVGSDMHVLLDGFTGKHVKVFIDGVPQEGVGNSFGLNNMPLAYANRIDIYKGVVPVSFGTDAIGGIVNIVTHRRRKPFWLDASYSYGSFNTHRTSVSIGRNFKNGLFLELSAFQNYSDNNYSIYVPVEDFETGRIDRDKMEWVERFHDTYHNESSALRLGIADKTWADRLALNLNYAQNYKDIQTGVRQDIVYGEKARRGRSVMSGVEYSKRGLAVEGLDLMLTANYNNNKATNIDTSQYKYNWFGEKKKLNSPGEQNRQYIESSNNNFNAIADINYRFKRIHSITFNNSLNLYWRRNTSLLATEAEKDYIPKYTSKNIMGLQYRVFPTDKYNIVVFGKWYRQYVRGPIATDVNSSNFVSYGKSTNSFGYGTAMTWFPMKGLQVKISYEKALRLPTIEEMFGDEDLEMGSVEIKPENSDNVNLNISYSFRFRRHSILLEGSAVYRNTQDFIQRNIVDLSGGKQAAAYVNYGRVLTCGWSLSARYNFSNWLSVGANFTRNDVRDNMRKMIGTEMPNVSYGERMPNMPYCFADADVMLSWNDFLKSGNTLSFKYENTYLHSFSFYPSHIGEFNPDYIVPTQFSHNVILAYSMKQGRYKLSVECRNLTNELLYDNFRLQKPGRSFYGKVMVSL